MDIGQLFIIGFDGTAMSPRLASLLGKIQPAGVILFARNISDPEQTSQLLRACQQQVRAPLFTCVDLEGGTVDRFRKVLGPSPSPAEVFATGDKKIFRKHGRVLGANCDAFGFNMDFAPVLDLAFEASRKVMSTRAVSDDPVQVSAYAREFLRGLAETGVVGCGKHFPGLGEATLDTHLALPSVNKTLQKMWTEDLVPYQILRRQLPMVMVSHAHFPGVKKTREQGVAKSKIPASLSRQWITDVLRTKIGYRGLICSDDLEMGGVLAAGSIEQAMTGHIRAGGDLGLICHQEDFILRAYEALALGVERDRRLAARVKQSSLRVLRFKKKRLGKNLSSSRREAVPNAALIKTLKQQLVDFTEEVKVSVSAGKAGA